MRRVVLGVVCSFFAYLVGVVIEIQPTVNLPGFGVVLALITLGGMIIFYQKKS